MRINQRLKDFLIGLLGVISAFGAIAASFAGLYYVFRFIWFLQDNNFFGFPIWTFLIVLFVIAAFINAIYNELKAKKLKPTRRNLINETKTQSIGFLLGGLILVLAIYLINLWYGFIFIFLIAGFLSTFRKGFRGK